MAPRLYSNWQFHLRNLKDGWDGNGGRSIGQSAIETVEHFSTVPTSKGGIQLEVHRDGFDIEIEIDRDGTILSVLICSEPNSAHPEKT